MIREKAINCKLDDLNDADDTELFETFIPSEYRCPECGAELCFEPHVPYTRYMTSITGTGRVDDLVTISRVICSSCGVTHALLPDILTPFSSYTLRFKTHVLRAYRERNCSVKDLCEYYQIAVSTLYRWKRLFREHANLLFDASDLIREITAESLFFIATIPALPSSFFYRFGFSFMQNWKQRAAAAAPG